MTMSKEDLRYLIAGLKVQLKMASDAYHLSDLAAEEWRRLSKQIVELEAELRAKKTPN